MQAEKTLGSRRQGKAMFSEVLEDEKRRSVIRLGKEHFESLSGSPRHQDSSVGRPEKCFLFFLKFCFLSVIALQCCVSVCCTTTWISCVSVCVCVLSHVQFFATPWTVVRSSVHGTFQAHILEWVAISSSRASSRPRIEPVSLAPPALAGRFSTTVPPGKVGESTYLIG